MNVVVFCNPFQMLYGVPENKRLLNASRLMQTFLLNSVLHRILFSNFVSTKRFWQRDVSCWHANMADADLEKLSVSPGKLKPTFRKNTTEYEIVVGSDVK